MSDKYSHDPEENLPDWLQELRRRQRETGSLNPEDLGAEEGSAAPEAEDAAGEEAAAEATSPESETGRLPQVPDTPPAEPDWLLEIRRRYQKESGGPAPRELPEVPADDELPEMDEEAALSDTQPNLFDRIEEAIDQGPSSEPKVEPETPGEAAIPEPDWLAAMEDDEEEIAEAAIPEPDWLTAMEDGEDADQETADSPAFQGKAIEDAASEPEEDKSDLPDWLNQDDEGGIFGSVPAFASDDDQASDLSPAELPSWLQALRPPGVADPVEPSISQQLLPEQENVGPLAGLSGVLPAEPGVVQFGSPRLPTGRLEITEGQQRHAATLSRLIAEENRPKEDFGKQIALPSRILNIVIAGALIIATLIPLLTGSRAATLPRSDVNPMAAELFSQIEALPANVPVLVAFDVEPGLYGELQAPAAAVLRHLLNRQARLVFISTQPTGPALVERLLQDQLSTIPSIATRNYVNLGYLSGGMAALRALSLDPRSATTEIEGLPNDPWQQPVLQNIATLNDFGLVLVISSETEDGRAWIEQTAPALADGLYMVTSAQAAPLMRPYVESHPQTLRGLVAGLPGAAFYEVLLGQSGLGRASWDAFSYGLGAAVVLILLGGLYNRLIHIRPEPAAKEGEDA